MLPPWLASATTRSAFHATATEATPRAHLSGLARASGEAVDTRGGRRGGGLRDGTASQCLTCSHLLWKARSRPPSPLLPLLSLRLVDGFNRTVALGLPSAPSRRRRGERSGFQKSRRRGRSKSVWGCTTGSEHRCYTYKGRIKSGAGRLDAQGDEPTSFGSGDNEGSTSVQVDITRSATPLFSQMRLGARWAK